MFFADEPLTPDEIVTAILHGIRAREPKRGKSS